MATEKRLMIAFDDIVNIMAKRFAQTLDAPVYSPRDILSALDGIPKVNAVEVVHGEWERIGEADYKCSVCGFRFTSGDPISMFRYCRCGAKMDGDGNG